MLAGLSVGTDIKRYLRPNLRRVALVTIVLLPLLYGAMYLWAFWDPFGQVGKIPVALVNEDRGAVAAGQQLRVGDQVAAALKGSHKLNLHEMTAAQAADGVAHGRYYFSVTLPADFSAAVASSSGPQPHQAQLRFAFDDANSYLATVIGQNAAREITNLVNSSIGEQVVGQVLTGLTDARQGLDRAAGGADQLDNGLAEADAGAERLSSGSRTLAGYLATARDGSQELAAGSGQLSSGITTATDPLLEVLDRVAALHIDPDELADTGAHLSAVAASAADHAAAFNINDQLATAIVNQIVGVLANSPDPMMRELGETLAGAQRLLNANGDSMADQLTRLRDDSQRLHDQLADPHSTMRSFLTKALNGQLRNDVTRLRDGAAALNRGAVRLSTGLVQLSSGADELRDGAGQLADGTHRLHDGADQLATGLHQGVEKMPLWTGQERTAAAHSMATPVQTDLEYSHRAATFGEGLAPFFLPLALFIGALVIWMLLSALQIRPIINGLSPVRAVLSSYWHGLLIAVCQVLVMYTVVRLGLGLHAAHPVAAVGFMFLVAATYVALIQAFNAVFGIPVGRVVSLGFLMVQLVSAGGIYPVETTAKPFQILHPFDPMTYAVNGLRELVAGGIDERLATSIAVLLCVLAASLAATVWAARRSRVFTFGRLHPALEI